MAAIVAGQGLGLANTSLGLLGGAGQLGSAGQGRSGEKVYVNASNGNLVVSQQDEWLVVPGPDIGFTRTYNSGATEDGDNNDNWRLGFGRNIVYAPNGTDLIRTGEDGNRSTFVPSGVAGRWISKDGDGSFDKIEVSGTTMVWTDGDTRLQETYANYAAGAYRLTSIRDVNNQTLSLSYDNTTGLITGMFMTPTLGAAISYHPGTRNIKDITTYAGDASSPTPNTVITKRVSYLYDGSNRLSSVTVDLTPDNTADASTYQTSYTYAPNGKLGSIVQSDGSALFIEYHPDGRVKTLTDWLGDAATSLETRFSYSGNETTVTMAGLSGTAASATRTYKLVYESAAGQNNQQLSHIDLLNGDSAYEQQAAYTYDSNGNVATATDARGMLTTYGYDSYGNRNYERDGQGNVVRRSYSTDGKNLLLSETRYVGLDTDGAGSGDATDPLTTRYAYDGDGHLRFVVTPDGRVTEHAYYAPWGTNRTGMLSSSVQYETLYAGSTNPLVLSEMATWTSGKVRSQRADYDYDYLGLLSQATTYEKLDSSGNGVADGTQSVRKYVHDQYGNLLQTIDGRTKTTVYGYDGLNRIKSVKDGEANTVTTVYDDAAPGGARTVISGANNRVTTQVYDKAGRLVSVQESDAGGVRSQASYVYDKLGQLRKVTAAGQSTYYLYDQAGRRSGEIDPERALTLYVYNGDGQLGVTLRRAKLVSASALTGDLGLLNASVVDPGSDAKDRYSLNFHDKAGRLERSVDASGAVVQYSYDGAGRLVKTTAYAKRLDASSQMSVLKFAVQVHASYGGTSDSIEEMAAGYATVAADANDRTTRQFYDNDGHLIATLDGEGTLAESIYDGAGRITQTRRYFTSTTSSLRASGTLAQLRPAANDARDELSVFFYDAKGQLAGSYAAFDYDATAGSAGHWGYLTTFAYDPAGNRITELRYAPKVKYTTGKTLSQLLPASNDALAPQNQKTSYEYDGNNRLKKATVATKGQEDLGAGNGSVTTYKYDAAGNLTETVRAEGVATEQRSALRRYDALGRVTQELSGVGVAKLAAAVDDAAREVVWNTYGTRHSYNADGRLVATVSPNGSDAAGNRTVFYYDKTGRLTHSINALGEVVKYGYNVFGERTSERRYAGRIASASLAGLAGGLNTETALASAMAASGITSESGQDSETLTAYNERGEAATLTDALGNASTRTYTAFGQLASRVDRIDATTTTTTTFTYSRTGHRQLQTDDSGGAAARTTFEMQDAFGRVRMRLDGLALATSYAYDRLGRVVMTTGDVSRTTTYDAFNRVMKTVDGTGKETTYAYDAVKREMKVTTPELVETVTETNRHGDIVKVTLKQAGDPLQRVTVYEYDANGNVSAVTTAQGTGAQSRTTTDYDTAGRAWKIFDARNTLTQIAYDAANRVLTRTVDAGTGTLNLTTRYRYDGKGQANWTQDANGVWTKTEYDKNGQVVAVTVDAGNPDVPNAPGLGLRTEFTYDARGKTLTVAQGVDLSQAVVLDRYAKAQVTRYVYDGLGRRVQEIVDPRRSPVAAAGTEDRPSALNLVTTYVYDNNDNVVARVDPMTKVTRYVYDGENRQIYAVDTTGAVTRTEYDAEGRVTRATAYAQRISVSGLPQAATDADIAGRLVPGSSDQAKRYVYDADGRLKYGVDALNYVSGYEYDAAGNVVKTTRYVTNGAVIAQNTNPAGMSPEFVTFSVTGLPATPGSDDRVEQTAYDAANRVVYSVDASLGVTYRRYDAVGNVIETRRYLKPMKAPLTTNGTVSVDSTPAEDQITRTVYDKANRAVFVIDAESYVTQNEYDLAGRVKKQTRFAGILQGSLADNVAPDVINSGGTSAAASYVMRAASAATSQDALTEYEYDNAGRLLQTKAASGGTAVSVSSRSYDKAGRVQTVGDSVGAAEETTTRYGYDTAGRLVAETRDQGRTSEATTRYELDNNGNRKKIIGANGVALAESNDAWARAMRQSLGYADSAEALLAEHKDALKARYTTTQLFDNMGRLTLSIDPLGGGTTTKYDAFGNALSVMDPNSSVGYFHFDKRNQVVLHVDPAGRAVATQYDAFGAAEKITRYVNSLQGEAVAGKLPQFGSTVPGTLPSGGFIQTVDPATVAGDRLTQIKYDKLGRQVEITDAAGEIEKSGYDGLGNRTTLTNKVDGLFTYAYDRLGRLKTETLPVETILLNATTGAIERQTDGTPKTVKVINEYTYDSRGNKTKSVEAKGLFEQRTTEYAYDRLNRLVKQTGEPVDVYTSEGATLPQQRPVETRKYDTRGNLIEVVDPNGARTLTFWDALNRKTAEIRATTRAADGTQTGTLTAYDYDDAGNVLAQRVYGTAVVLPAAGGVRPGAADVLSGVDLHATAYVYDGAHRVTETRLANVTVGAVNAQNGNYEIRTQDLVTKREYDLNGNLVVETDARGNSVYHYYDAAGNHVAQIDAGRYLTKWGYDAGGKVTEEIRYDLPVGPGVQLSAYLETSSLSVSGAQVRTTRNKLDKLGRLLEQTVYNVQAASVTSAGVVTVVPANGDRTATTRFDYDGLGNVIRKTEASGEVLEWIFDKQGRVTSEWGAPFVPVGETVEVTPKKDTEYNGLSLIARKLELGPNAGEADDRITSFTYDKNGLLASETDAMGGAKLYAYDAAGNQTKVSTARYARDALQGAGKLYIDRVFGNGDWTQINSASPLAWNAGLVFSSEVSLGQHSMHRNFMVGLQNRGSGVGLPAVDASFRRHDANFVGDDLYFSSYTAAGQTSGVIPRNPQQKLKDNTTYVVEVSFASNGGQYVSILKVYEKGQPASSGWEHQVTYPAPWAQVTAHAAAYAGSGASTAVDAIDNFKIVNGTQTLFSEDFSNTTTASSKLPIDSTLTGQLWWMDAQWRSKYSVTDVVETQYDLAGREVRRLAYTATDPLQGYAAGAGKLSVRRLAAGTPTWSEVNGKTALPWSAGTTFATEVRLGADATGRNFMIGLQSQPTGPGMPAIDANFRRLDAYFYGTQLRVQSSDGTTFRDAAVLRDPQQPLKSNATYLVQIDFQNVNGQYVGRLRVYEKGQDPSTGWSTQVSFGTAPWTGVYVHAANMMNATPSATQDTIDNITIANNGQVTFFEDFNRAGPAAANFNITNNGSGAYTFRDDSQASWETRYDAYGQVIAKGRNGGFQESAQYDAAGRLVRATGPEGVPRIYLSDAVGNVTLTLRPPANGETPSNVAALYAGSSALTSQDYRTLMAAGGNATVSAFSARNQLTDTFEVRSDQLLASMNAVNLTVGGQAARPYDIDPPVGMVTAGQSVAISYTLASTFISSWTGGSGNDRTVQQLDNYLDLRLSNSGLPGSKYRIVLHVDAGHYHAHGKGYIQAYDQTWEMNDPAIGTIGTMPNGSFQRYKTGDYRSDFGGTGGANYTLKVYKVLDDLDPTKIKEVASFASVIPGLNLPPYFTETVRYVDGEAILDYIMTDRAAVTSIANFQAPNPRQMTITSLPGTTQKVYLQYRIKNQAPAAWATTVVPYTGGSAVFGEQLLKDLGTTLIPAGVSTALEFNLYAVDSQGKVVSSQSGEVGVTRDTAATPVYTYASVLTSLKVLRGQSGQVFWSAGKLVYAPPVLAKDAPVAVSATIRYRTVGQSGWTAASVGTPFGTAPDTPAGWFKFDPPTAGTVNEYVIEFKDNAGRVVSSVAGYLTKTGSNYASTTVGAYEQRASAMHFSNVPPEATKATLNYTLTRYTFDAQGNAVVAGTPTTGSAALTRSADGNFDWDAAQVALDPSSRYLIDFTFTAQTAANQTVATLIGREGIDPLGKLAAQPSTTATRDKTESPAFQLSGPKQVKLTHSAAIGKLARKAYMYYRAAGSTAPYQVVSVTGTPNANDIVESFSFDLSGVAGAGADLDVYYRYETAGNAVINGTFSFALSNVSGQVVATLAGQAALDPQAGFGANIYSPSSASSQFFRVSGPKVRLVHADQVGSVARKAYLYYRPAGTTQAFTALPVVNGTPNAAGIVESFEFDLTSLVSGDYADYDVYYRYEDASGNNVLVSSVVGAPNASAPTQTLPVLLRLLPQKAYTVEATSANIAMVGLASSVTASRRQQVYNAFGEVVQEYTATALDRIRKEEARLGHALTEAERAVYGTTSVYDGAGRLIEKLEAKTSVVQESGFQIDNYRSSTKYVYDKQGRLIRQTDANDNETIFVLLKAGNGQRLVQKEIGVMPAQSRQTVYAYDVFGDLRRKTIVTGAADVVTDYAYDKMHRVVRVDQPAEAGSVRPTDLYFYDSAGNRVAHQTSPDGAANAGGSFDKSARVYTDRSFYDGQRRSVGSMSAEGLQTTTTYQVQGGLDYRKVVDENGKTSEEWLDYAGRVVRRINLGGERYKYKYNLAGSLIEQIGVASFSDTTAKAGGQNIRFEYYEDGTLKTIRDIALGTVTNYGYDLDGNKTYEGYQNAGGGVVYQASNATYDELGRVKTITDTRYALTYTYDKVGNRRSVEAVRIGGDTGTGANTVEKYWYAYDQLNRMVVSMGTLDGVAATSDDGSKRIVKGTGKGVQLGYDAAGNRGSASYGSGSVEFYEYTKGGHLTNVRSGTVNGNILSTRTSDLLGRVTEYVEYRPLTSTVAAYTDTQKYAYDADGRVVWTQSDSTKAKSSKVVTDIYYTEVPTQAAPYGGRKTALQQWSKAVSTPHADVEGNPGPSTTHTKYTYAYFDNAQQLEIKVDMTNVDVKEKSWGRWADGVSKFVYDVNGHVASVGDSIDGTGTNMRNIAFINNAQGLVLNRTETGLSGTVPSQSYFYFDGKRVAEWGNNPGISSIDYSTALATPAIDNPKDRYRNIGPITSNFDQNYQPINASYPSFVPGSYKVRSGEDLQTIARAVWGDASMWYLIAEANGFTANQQPREGQLLVIPNKVTNFHNTSQTFKVYNPGEVMGDVSPTVPEAPTPPLPKLDNGCGVIGQIIMIVVAVVATIYTAGAASGWFASTAAATTGTTTTMGAGLAALGAGSSGAVALGAIAGAVGSVASQLVGMAIGNVDKFSWSGVAMGAIGGAASAAAGGLVGDTFGKATLPNVIAKAAVGNAISQGVAVMAGLQQKFSWTGVAAAAVGSAAAYGVTKGLDLMKVDFGSEVANKIGYGTAAGIGNGLAQAAVFRKQPNLAQIAVQSFGNALGDQVVETLAREPLPESIVRASETDPTVVDTYRKTESLFKTMLPPVKAAAFAAKAFDLSRQEDFGGALRGFQLEILDAAGVKGEQAEQLLTDIGFKKEEGIVYQGYPVVSDGASDSRRATPLPVPDSVFGKFTQQYSTEFAQLAKASMAIGEYIEERPWAKYGLLAVEASAGILVFAGRQALMQSPIGEALENLQQAALRTASGYVNDEAKLNDIEQAGLVTVGGVTALGLVLGGVKLFQNVARTGRLFSRDIAAEAGQETRRRIKVVSGYGGRYADGVGQSRRAYDAFNSIRKDFQTPNGPTGKNPRLDYGSELHPSGKPKEVTIIANNERVQIDADGYPVLDPFLYNGPEGTANVVRIRLTGNYSEDFRAADRLAGFENGRPDGYVWHHHQDLGVMQLVRTDVHGAVPHSGGVSFFNALIDANKIVGLPKYR